MTRRTPKQELRVVLDDLGQQFHLDSKEIADYLQQMELIVDQAVLLAKESMAQRILQLQAEGLELPELLERTLEPYRDQFDEQCQATIQDELPPLNLEVYRDLLEVWDLSGDVAYDRMLELQAERGKFHTQQEILDGLRWLQYHPKADHGDWYDHHREEKLLKERGYGN